MNYKQRTPRQRLIQVVTQQIAGQPELGLADIAPLMEAAIAADPEVGAYWAQASGGARRKVKSLIKHEVAMARLVFSPASTAMQQAGQLANQEALDNIFADYQARRSENTLRRQVADLALFARYLAARATPLPSSEILMRNSASWRGVTWGLVAGFVAWQLEQGYAINSINARLSTVKIYCRLAAQAGVIPPTELALIKEVSGFSYAEGVNVDRQRAVTRVGAKKQAAVSLTSDQAAQLKQRPDTWQGWRDRVLLCLLIDHGLRASEVADLQTEDVDLEYGLLTFYRRKIRQTQKHELSPDTLEALKGYDMPGTGPLLWSSTKGGHRRGPGMSVRAINQRVGMLGAQVGVEGLSPHDLRHSWATQHADQPFQLLKAGGWCSLATVMRYIHASEIANQGL
ncbi:MAG: tyrosine-type recombinase/integrase [Anaerolineae bacterium]|nr:tyrosine-type recombinase/integrase [Anaerolineae bacterium]